MWTATLVLVFGGCCSNALTLEKLTSQHPDAGSLLTFFQFLIISLYGLPNHVVWTTYGPRFKLRTVPLTQYAIQVALFYLISLLNNAAFSYRIPMTVHIIFRSGGLIISMLLGWIIAGKQYTLTQVLSVIFVTLGVVLATLSASPSPNTVFSTKSYASGIVILTLALVFSGFLGLVQDHTYSKYGRPMLKADDDSNSSLKHESGKATPTWQESMFYLHFLALPMFYFVRTEVTAQFKALSSGPTMSLTLPILSTLHIPTIIFPVAYLSLLLNTVTQLLCVAGVHRLTTRVSALTVTLVLVVRKAVSLVLSALGFGLAGKQRSQDVNPLLMWGGSLLVLTGTVTYTIGFSKKAAEGKQD